MVLDPQSDNYNPVPAASCLLDPTVAAVLLQPEFSTLLNAAKLYICSEAATGQNLQETAPEGDDASTAPAPESSVPVTPKTGLGKFRFLSKQIQAAETTSSTTRNPQSPANELTRYLIEVQGQTSVVDALDFWKQQKVGYPLLAPLAEDLISAPASEAFVERIFSVAGMLSAGRRNRMKTSLEMRVFLKLNSRFLDL